MGCVHCRNEKMVPAAPTFKPNSKHCRATAVSDPGSTSTNTTFTTGFTSSSSSSGSPPWCTREQKREGAQRNRGGSRTVVVAGRLL